MEKIKVTRQADLHATLRYSDIKEKTIKETYMLFVSEMYNSGHITIFEESGGDTTTYGLLGYCLSHDEFIEIGRLIKSIKTILPIEKQWEVERLDSILTNKN